MQNNLRKKLEQTLQRVQNYEKVVESKNLNAIKIDPIVAFELRKYCFLAIQFMEKNADLSATLEKLADGVLGVNRPRVIMKAEVEDKVVQKSQTSQMDLVVPLDGNTHTGNAVTAVQVPVNGSSPVVSPVPVPVAANQGTRAKVTCTESIEGNQDPMLMKMGPNFNVVILEDMGEKAKVQMIEKGYPPHCFVISKEDLQTVKQ